MSDDHSLLAYLVPRLTPQVEDAATDALAYILNTSEGSRKALVDLVSGDGFRLNELDFCRTQVVRDDQSRLDLVGYDTGGRACLVIESKFWAQLLDGQASGYIDYLTPDGPSLLLFVAPEVRHAKLWNEIEAQFRRDKPDARLTLVEHRAIEHVAVVEHEGQRKRVALLSWGSLLQQLESDDPPTAPDIRQLQGLARAQDDVAFAPLHTEDLGATIPRRLLDFNRIINDVVGARGVHDGWMTTEGLKAAPQSDGHLRYFRFVDQNSGRTSTDLALCVSYEQWARSGDTPLWLRIWHNRQNEIDAIRRSYAGTTRWRPGDHMWIPLQLRTGVEYHDVLEFVSDELKKIGKIILV